VQTALLPNWGIDIWQLLTVLVYVAVLIHLVLLYGPVDLFAGRYALRYGKVAGDAIKKQMAQIPGGLVSYFITM